MYFHKLNVKLPKELKDEILSSGLLEIIKKLNHPSVASVAKDRGIWPLVSDKEDPIVDRHVPGLTQRLHKLYFGKEAKPEELGEVRFFWGIGGSDAFQPPHADGYRACTINVNLIGCDGMEVKFYNTKGPLKPALDTTLDNCEEVDSFVMGEDDVWLQDTITVHMVPEEFWKNRFMLILMYSWYDGDFDMTHSYKTVYNQLAENGMLAENNGKYDNEADPDKIDYSISGRPDGDSDKDGYFLVIGWKEEGGQRREHFTWVGAFRTPEEAEETAQRKIQVGHPRVYSRYNYTDRTIHWPLKWYKVVKGLDELKMAIRKMNPNVSVRDLKTRWTNY